MRARFSLLVVSALILTACEGGGDPVEQALREEAANNHAEAELARMQQEEERSGHGVSQQSEIDELRRQIMIAEAALETSDDAELRAAAQASLDENRQALAALEGQD